jgi:hypothetical protein
MWLAHSEVLPIDGHLRLTRRQPRGQRQGETPAGMAAGVSIGDEGQGREGGNLDSS